MFDVIQQYFKSLPSNQREEVWFQNELQIYSLFLFRINYARNQCYGSRLYGSKNIHSDRTSKMRLLLSVNMVWKVLFPVLLTELWLVLPHARCIYAMYWAMYLNDPMLIFHSRTFHLFCQHLLSNIMPFVNVPVIHICRLYIPWLVCDFVCHYL